MSKTVIYQLLPRYFTNQQPNPVSNGDIRQNGCGKLEEITDRALSSIRALGVTHIWLTGGLEQATKTDYTAYGIARDHPAVVKGNAGSPFAIKDYYDISPELAVDPANRLAEFDRLVARCHAQGLKVLIDFVPNHVARQYHSDQAPSGIRDFGIDDHQEYGFDPSNNFYYLGEPLDLQVDPFAGSTVPYTENPARATGNDCFHPHPGPNDWYDTVKLNYGVNYFQGGGTYFNPIPVTWFMMLDILTYWVKRGVDGFRCDMVEMVPVEFWNWLMPRIRRVKPDILFVAETYRPDQYRQYLYEGGFDYLYDKVGMYETLRGIVEGHRSASEIAGCWQAENDILPHLLFFLENHDEQRMASRLVAGDPFKALPALLVAAFMHVNPIMIYAGQELGETGDYSEGFSGPDGRNTIYDYWSLDTLRAWNHQGKWDEALLTACQKSLRRLYGRILNLTQTEKALAEGSFFDLTYANVGRPGYDDRHLFSFLRKKEESCILVVANFSSTAVQASLFIPTHAFEYLEIPENPALVMTDLLNGKSITTAFRRDQTLELNLPPNLGVALKFHG